MYLIWKSVKMLLIGVAALVVVLGVVGLITRKALPDNSERIMSSYFPPNPEGRLAKLLANDLSSNAEKSGIYPLANGRDAFLARLALVETAQYSLDLQYYIWHDDISGRLLAQSLLRAAERGVRVRLLLDDHTMAGMEPHLISIRKSTSVCLILICNVASVR